ncbi:PglZ domain protein, partial [gut metagenome]
MQPYIKKSLDDKLTAIFGISYNCNSPARVEKIVQVLKYNAIVQNLAPVEADNYKTNRITDSISLQHINRILELALSTPKTATPFKEAVEELGGDIRDENIIAWYGTDANYNHVTDGLCIPIVKSLIQNDITDNPDKVINRLEELMLGHNENSGLMDAMEYVLIVSRFYERSFATGSFTLNTPGEYIAKYQSDFFLLDQLYRQAT